MNDTTLLTPPSLPLELVKHIAEILVEDDNRQTAATLMRCSKTCFDVICPILYRHITLTRDNSSALFAGFNFPPPIGPALCDAGPPPENNSGLWPDVRIPNEDEEQANSESAVSTYMPYHYTPAAHHRKLKCLAWTQHLHVDEVPPMAICHALGRLYGVRKMHSQKLNFPYIQIFTGVQTLVVGSKAIWSLADWHNRLSVPSDPHYPQPHPFSLWLALEVSPIYVHMTYPTLTQEIKNDWINLRNGPREVVDVGEGQVIRTLRLKHHWMTFVSRGYWSALLGMVMKWLPRQLIQNNIVGAHPLACCAEESIVIFANCQCSVHPDTMTEDQCPDHVDAPRRARRVLKMLESMRNSAAMIDAYNRHPSFGDSKSPTDPSLPPTVYRLEKPAKLTAFRWIGIGKVAGEGTEDEKTLEIMETIKLGSQGRHPSFNIEYKPGDQPAENGTSASG